MGLDMYLSARQYVRRRDFDTGRDTPIFKTLIETVNARDIVESEGWAGATVEIPVAYWRKANWLHNWFVNHVQNGNDDCGQYSVPMEKLKELQATIREVLNNPVLARAKLSAVEGFFFGSTDIYNDDMTLNDYYKETLEYTLEVINKVVGRASIMSYDTDYIYQSSW